MQVLPISSAAGSIVVAIPDAIDATLRLFSSQVAAATAKATANTAQWQSLKAALDSELNSIISGGFWYGVVVAADFALAYQCLKDTDPTTAADYAGKAIGIALSCARDNHFVNAGAWQSLGDGDGLETDFTLPGTSVVSASLAVYLLDDTDPPGTAGGLVNPADYTLVGTTITFDIAPAAGKTVWAECVYHDGTQRYRQTGNGLGGVAFITANTDNIYPDRNLAKSVAPVVDWCWSFADFATADKNELLQFLVDASDMSRDASYRPAEKIESNYGVGRFINRAWAMVAVQGRHAADARLLSEMLALYDTIHDKFGASFGGVSSIKGGFPGEGMASYGNETSEHILLAAAALNNPEFDESADPIGDITVWAGEAIRYQLHARYSDTTLSYSGETRPGRSFEAGDSSAFPVPVASTRIFAIASGIASSSLAPFARYLIANGGGERTYDAWDLLFYDPALSATDWSSTEAVTYQVDGSGIVFSRSGWTSPASWIAVHCGQRAAADHDETTAGYLTAYRSDDKLLVNASAVGWRYNPNVAGPWANLVTVDDGGAQQQLNRWSSTQLYSTTSVTRTPVVLPTVDESNGHVAIDFDYRGIYCKDAAETNPCSELNATVLFFPAAGYVFRYDRVTTTNAAYAKHLRYHTLDATHPVGVGTVTLSQSGGGTGNAIAWNADAATVKSEIDTLFSVSSTVTKQNDGYWIVNLGAGTHAAIAGTASDGQVEVYDYHPEGGAGAKTIQHVVLVNTLTTDPQQNDQGSSRMFLRVDSSETLVRTATLLDAGHNTTNKFCRRFSFQAPAVATVRFATAIQLTADTTESMDTTVFVTGTNGQLEGYHVGNKVVLFRKTTSAVTFPEVITITGSGTNEWHAIGLPTNTTYDLTGTVQATVTTNAYGNAYFTTTATNPTVTIDEYTPVGGTPVFSLTAVADASVGITSTLAGIFGTAWIWTLRTVVFGDSGQPSIVIAPHNGTAGGAIYDRGTGWSYAEVAETDYAIDPRTQISNLVGGILFFDVAHDGDIDWAHFGSSVANKDWRYNSSTGELEVAAQHPWGGLQYIDEMYERASDNRLEVISHGWPQWPQTLNCPLRKSTFNGTTWTTTTNTTLQWPAGIPTATMDEIEAFLDDGSQDATKRWLRFKPIPYDLTGDGVADDLIVNIFNSYSEIYRCWFLTNDGDDTYTDRTAEWGLPTGGGHVILPAQFGHQRPFGLTPVFINHDSDFSAAGANDLFISTNGTAGGYHGHYRWNGTGYTKLTSSPLTARLGEDDVYVKRMYLADFTRNGSYDLVLQKQRSGVVYIFLNDGSGNFTEHSTRTAWDADGFDALIDESTGLTHLVFGGDGGSDSGVPSSSQARVVSIYENTTTDPGNYLGVKLRRSGHPNKFSVGAKVEVFAPGQSFVPSALIQAWFARCDGQAMIFGVGAEATVDHRTTWPDGSTSDRTAVSVNQVVTETGV